MVKTLMPYNALGFYFIKKLLPIKTQDAEEVLQDAYITAFLKINAANPEKFQGWLDTIVINRANLRIYKLEPIFGHGGELITNTQREKVKCYVGYKGILSCCIQ